MTPVRRVFDVQAHPIRAAYTMIFFCLVLMGVLMYSIVKGQEVAHLKGEVDSDKQTRIIACETNKPKNNQLIEALILILREQEASAQAALSTTSSDAPIYKVRQGQVENFRAGIELLRYTKKAPCT